ncbi:MAG: T9SS C-terminal target domain-containing protein [Balneola sp.]|nr:MAG: T9SS C-terminal target domain-containing protein [Balneola sp.]
MKKLSLLLGVFMLFSHLIYAQNTKYNVVVYVQPDSLELPNDRNEISNVSDLARSSKGLYTRLSALNMNKISKTFSEFSSRDTVEITPDGRKIKRMDLSRVFTLSFNSEKKALEAIEALSGAKGVLFAEPDWGITPSTIIEMPNDDEVPDQWHLNNTGQNGGTVDADIDAFEAWQEYDGDGTVKVAIIDTGIDDNQIDLSGKTTGDDPPNSAFSNCRLIYSHGTHIGGLVGAKIGAGAVRGVNSNAQLISKNIYNESCNPVSSIGASGIFNKIIQAKNEGASVINFSSNSSGPITLLNEAFAYSYKYGLINVNSMGNIGPGENQNSSSPEYPAASFGHALIQVGSTDRSDIISNFSRTGAHIDLVAPGEDILSTWTFSNLDDPVIQSGTSQAARIVSGAAALLFEYGYQEIPKYLFNDDIQQLLKISADKVEGMDGSNFTPEYGYGRLNIKNAIDQLQSPYILNHHTATGGTTYSSTGYYSHVFYGVPGLADGPYLVRRYEVRKNISFSYMSEAHVWGRGVASNGWTLSNPNYGIGYTDVINVTNTSATLRSYVYFVKSIDGISTIGWVPQHPSNVSFGYTVHGIQGTPPAPAPSVTVNGPTNLFQGTTGTFTANIASGTGTPPFSYTWYHKNDNSTYWSQVFGVTGNTYVHTAGAPNGGRVKVVVNDAASKSDEDEHYFTIIGGFGGEIVDKKSLPEEFDLLNNYPNPFNPSTEITYALPEQSEIEISVYNVMGQKISTLINAQQNAGFHTVTFDGNNLANGLYIARLTVQSRGNRAIVKEIKMQLIK